MKNVALFFLLVTNTAYGASGASNGTDNVPVSHDSSWFITNHGESRPVNYCVQMAPNFGVDKDTAIRSIEAAAKIWRDYIAKKKHVFMFSFPPSLDYQKVDCDHDPDLTFYFGVRNKLVNSYITPGHVLWGFAQRTEYDFGQKWGKGFIWIAPSNSIVEEKSNFSYPKWEIPSTLTGILAHEIGHVLGVQHIPGTLMTPRYATALRNVMISSPDRHQSLLAVDSVREIIQCEYHCQSEPYFDLMKPSNKHDADARKFYKRLLGRDINGNLKLTLVKGDPNELQQEFTLNIEDESGSQKIVFKVEER